MTRQLSRQRRDQILHHEQGLCTRCSEAALTWYCPRHHLASPHDRLTQTVAEFLARQIVAHLAVAVDACLPAVTPADMSDTDRLASSTPPLTPPAR